MKQACFLIGNSLNKEKDKISESGINIEKEVNKNIAKLSDNKNIIIDDIKGYNKPKKLVENIYYFY